MHFRNQGMTGIRCATDLIRLVLQIPFVGLLNSHYGQKIVLRAAKGDLFADNNSLAANGKRDGNRKQSPVRQTHFLKDTLIVSFSHKANERRKTSRSQQLKIA